VSAKSSWKVFFQLSKKTEEKKCQNAQKNMYMHVAICWYVIDVNSILYIYTVQCIPVLQ
jgi:hypothetical protein